MNEISTFMCLAALLIIATLAVWGRQVIVKRNKVKRAEELRQEADEELRRERREQEVRNKHKQDSDITTVRGAVFSPRLQSVQSVIPSRPLQKREPVRASAVNRSHHRHNHYDDNGYSVADVILAAAVVDSLSSHDDTPSFSGGGGSFGGGGSSASYDDSSSSSSDCGSSSSDCGSCGD